MRLYLSVRPGSLSLFYYSDYHYSRFRQYKNKKMSERERKAKEESKAVCLHFQSLTSPFCSDTQSGLRWYLAVSVLAGCEFCVLLVPLHQTFTSL